MNAVEFERFADRAKHFLHPMPDDRRQFLIAQLPSIVAPDSYGYRPALGQFAIVAAQHAGCDEDGCARADGSCRSLSHQAMRRDRFDDGACISGKEYRRYLLEVDDGRVVFSTGDQTLNGGRFPSRDFGVVYSLHAKVCSSMECSGEPLPFAQS